MNSEQLAPPRRSLLHTTVLAVLLAAAILVTIVLPAEYGIDPSGVGRLLGLSALGEAKRATLAAADVPLMHAHPRKFHSSRIEIALDGHGQVEYKAGLERGEPMLYSWRVRGGPVYFEFHGEPSGGNWPQGYYRSYQIGQSATQAHGSFLAGFTGQHGWYWRNLSAHAVTITLEASGYYSRLGPVTSGTAVTE